MSSTTRPVSRELSLSPAKTLQTKTSSPPEWEAEHSRVGRNSSLPGCTPCARARHPSSSTASQRESCSIPVCYKDGVSKRLCTVVAEEWRRVQQDVKRETGFLLLVLPRVKCQSSPPQTSPVRDKGSQRPLEAKLLHPSSHRHCLGGQGLVMTPLLPPQTLV